jgi:hypothetical protein
MTLVREARAISASKLSLEQDNKEGVHLVGVVAPATVYRAVCVELGRQCVLSLGVRFYMLGSEKECVYTGNMLVCCRMAS